VRSVLRTAEWWVKTFTHVRRTATQQIRIHI
jgi:hypothetical protein